MEKCVTQWHRIGISINSNTKPPQYCCFASPEIAKHLFKEIEINERYFVIIHLFLLVKILLDPKTNLITIGNISNIK